MDISTEEQAAIATVLEMGERFGYGNLIAHLKTAWARMLMKEYGMKEKDARAAAGGDGYPFKMQDDLLNKGWWDETGRRYRKLRERRTR